MKNDNLRKALEANRFYYAQVYETMRPEHERIRIEQKRILHRVYREVSEMEGRLRTIEEEFGCKYTYYKPFYIRKDDDSSSDGSGDGSDPNSLPGNPNSLPGDPNSIPGDPNSVSNYNPDEPRVPAGQPGGGQWTSGGDTGSGQVIDDAGNLYPLDDPSLPKPDGIPDNWMIRPSRDNTGIRYTDPNNTGNEVRIMPGDPDSDFPVQQEPYVRWMNNGKFLDKAGNVTSDLGEAHIPLDEFEFLPEVFLP